MSVQTRPAPNLPHALARAAVILALAAVAGCATRSTRAPVEDRTATPPRPSATATVPSAAAPAASAPEASGPTYTVKRGDTLYQIALDAGLDYRELAAWNSIENVNIIRVGQVLRLTAPGSEPAASPSGVTTAPLRTAPAVVEAKPGAPAPATATPAPIARNTENYKSQPKAFKEPYSEQAMRDAVHVAAPPPEQVAMAAPTPSQPPKVDAQAARPGAADGVGDDDDKLDWVWPAKGKVIGSFSETANLKGIDIGGTAGQPIFASASGTVVYAGTGLRGYGKLIIVKHNKTYLSAYAHNRDILVKEGEKVTKGQKIAEMGNTDTTEVKLHFEIRRLGKPMDPTRYLPPA
ncbi:MAG TPA: peptidoglycan DD-metalloendopeptidase family protein [Casimicrobiaceae bacterium]|nr:peptidoglycan DD-metalloendopeptidase family protein [Casimicrobiaceae bacterium]